MAASFILAINIALGAAIMIAFLAFGLFDRSQKAAFWWFGACIAGVASGALEYMLPAVEITALLRFLIFFFFALALACLAAGLSQRYLGSVPKLLLATALAAASACYLVTAEYPRDSLVRNIGYQAPYVGLQLLGLSFVLRGMSRSLIDRAVVAGLTLNAAQFAIRPAMVGFFGGNGELPQHYLQTTYAMASQTLMAISTIIVAFLLGIRMLADILGRIRDDSQIDALSGMLNRSAFENQANATLLARSGGVSRALVLCDLDHFKAINDTYGHPVGDIVIAAFGRMIEDMKRTSDVSGRIGGEEFCILLRNCDAAGARLFAEQLREAFLNERFDLADVERSFTASFGVTEMLPGERFEDAFSRADEALYAAKRSGRNRVCTLLDGGLKLVPRAAAVERLMGGSAGRSYSQLSG